MLYPAMFKIQDNDCYVISFRDIPEALTQAFSLNEAKDQALDALITAFEFYQENNKLIPMPSHAIEGEHYIEVPISVWSKILLINEMLNQHVSQSELAKRLNTTRQEMQRIINIQHNTKIDKIVDSLKLLGKSPKFEI